MLALDRHEYLMGPIMRAITLTCLAITLLAACGNTDRPLRDLSIAGGGPDAFAVIPQEPLQLPDQSALPPPTPGQSNLADPRPNADAIAALGGSAAAQIAGGVPSSDNALVAQTGRYGVDPMIRGTLAAEDKARLDRARRTNIFNPLGRDRYFSAYAGQALDADAELARLRNLGIAVPVAPAATQAPLPRNVTPQGDEEEPRFLQRTLDAWIEQVWGESAEADDTPQNCVFKTLPPDNRLRRVCTPIEQGAE